MEKKYNCKCCNYSTNIHCNWNKHLKTKKHLIKNKTISEDPIRSQKILKDPVNFIKSQLYNCKYCNKSFTRSNNRSKHEKKCPENIYNQELSKLKNEMEIQKIKYEAEIKTLRTMVNKLDKQTTTNVTNIQYIINKVPNPYNLNKDERYGYLFNQNKLNLEDISNEISEDMDSDLDEETKSSIFIENLFPYIKLNTLHELLSEFLLKLYKKKDITKQSIHVSDCSRLRFVYAELEKGINKVKWKKDFKGVKITKIIIDPLLKYIEERVLKYQTELIKKIKKDMGKNRRDANNLAITDKLMDMLDETNKRKKDYELKSKILNYIAPRLEINKEYFELIIESQMD